MRGLLVGVVLLVALLVVGDRVAVHYAAQEVATVAQQRAHLATKPDVSIDGFPFLNQVVAGHYDEVDVVAHDVHRGKLRLDTVTLRLFGIHLDVSEALRGRVAGLPVDHGDGTVLLTYPDAVAAAPAGHNLTLARNGDRVRVTGTVDALGRQFHVTGDAAAAVGSQRVTITPSNLTADGVALPAPVEQAAVQALTFQLAVPDLPFGLVLQSVKVGDQGLTLGGATPKTAFPSE